MRELKRKKVMNFGLMLVVIGIAISTGIFAGCNTQKKETKPEPTVVATPTPTPTPTPEPTPTPNTAQKDTAINNSTGTKNAQYYRELFKNSLFIGDSISEGLTYYEYIDEKNALALRGASINAINDGIKKLDIKNPKNIYLLIGSNELVANPTTTKFIEDYSKVIDTLKVKYPTSKLYINSITPVTKSESGKKGGLSNSNIDEKNEALKKYAKDKDIQYLDIASLIKQHGEALHEADGVHFKPSFYPIWLDYISTK